MFKNINIGNKIAMLVFAVVTITVVAISFVAYTLVEQSLADRYMVNLEAINKLKKEKIEHLTDRQQTSAHLIRQYIADSRWLQEKNEAGDLAEPEDTSLQLLKDKIQHLAQAEGYIHDVCLVTREGKIVFNTNPDNTLRQEGNYFDDPNGETLRASSDATYFSHIFEQNGAYHLFLGMPLTGTDPYVLLVDLKAEPFFAMVDDVTGLGRSGETILGKVYKDKIVYLNPLRHTKGKEALKKGVYLHEAKQTAIQRAAENTSGAILDTDYRGEKTLAVWDFIPSLQWGIVTKIDQNEIFDNAHTLLRRFIIAGAVIVVCCWLISLIFSRFLIEPLLSLKSTLKMLSQGMLPEKVEKKSNDEIGQMAETTGQLVKALKNTAHFARTIGDGTTDTDFQPLGEQDTLGNALIDMRNNIQASEKRDRERNWIVIGVAEVGEILRSHNDLEALGEAVIAYVTKKINAVQGAFYIVNDEDEDNVFIEMKASYAYNKKKHLKAHFKFAEGLVGQAAAERDTVLRTEIPYDYVTITSGLLGDQRPEALLIVPLITNEEVYGILEFAGFEKFSARDVKFVEEISLITARTVFNIKVNERTRRLLSESQEMSNELQEQQEILRQNAEEMQATQEELKRTNQQLEEQFEEVERTQKRMASLLENASEVITIYEEDGKIRYISPSIQKIFGYQPEEMIGRSDMQNIGGEGVVTFGNLFNALLQNPKDHVTVQYLYETKDRGEVWVEATGTNLLSDPAVRGIILNSRDITERKRAEQEERMRSKMQALSENSPDLITRIDQEGTFFYINPTIEAYTGKKPDEFLKKNISESSLNPAIVTEWLHILDNVKATKKKVAREMDFPTHEGARVMQVNAIPEFDEEEKIESVLVVSHDITERKLIEIEIESKNKKINDSINYAQRIQGAILPDNEMIKQAFPESFIYYKARDVVSGDFPWFVQQGEYTYIAAVDCTGHGVPGALISLIGYFLLNDIVKSRGITEPGIILDMLDEGVTQTLRQHSEDSKSKDGMDIALCRIANNQVQYAGAHRSLYYMCQGEMNEIKGNKFPIGGGIYKNQTSFTTHTIKVNKGDSVYFCSDGFPDQFGGPEVRKFGPKRLRDIIEENHHRPMDEVYATIATAWEQWKGDEKQTDDVLMIGIKF